ncbi:APC family permease [Allosphingosinicella indica]|uniref:Amino acid/polyamine/organocation transporter, APC superfamily n=1 Tax=Allosphingosinicella indica TaxID=941907 RepID=A0A1X7H1G8_9SPHN|nr:amino acid permease [Allosphingosinicella indica]SMF77936.1 amino acid/polyamine/organocation transporter, APC superfamily [Allosphingosinicella indica]
MTAEAEARASGPGQTLGLRHVIVLTVGIVIGAGIFRTPSLVAANAGSETVFLLTWFVGGLLSIVGALVYAELASTYPSAGGDYHFLTRAFGRRLSFLYAWARLSVIQTGSIALLAFVFGDYIAAVLPIGPMGPAFYAAGAVIAFTLINWLHVHRGMGSQMWLTAMEVGGLLLIIGAGLLFAPEGTRLPPPSGEAQVGLVLVFVLLTFGGWSEAAYVSAELRGPKRRIAWALVGGLTLVTVLYLLVNYAYLRVLGLDGIAGSEAVASDMMNATLGPTGAVVISLMVAIAALTSLNASAITGARTSYAMGRNFPQLAWLGKWDEAHGTPRNALVAQAVIALALVIAGAFTRDGFQHAVEYTAPVFWLFLLLVGVSLFVLRARDPGAERPFRVPLYPMLPALFCLTSAYLLYSSLAYTGASALFGVAVLGVGALLLLFLEVPNEEEVTA